MPTTAVLTVTMTLLMPPTAAATNTTETGHATFDITANGTSLQNFATLDAFQIPDANVRHLHMPTTSVMFSRSSEDGQL